MKKVLSIKKLKTVRPNGKIGAFPITAFFAMLFFGMLHDTISIVPAVSYGYMLVMVSVAAWLSQDAYQQAERLDKFITETAISAWRQARNIKSK